MVEADTVSNGTLGIVRSVLPPGDVFQIRWDGNRVIFANARWVTFVARANEPSRSATVTQGSGVAAASAVTQGGGVATASAATLGGGAPGLQ